MNEFCKIQRLSMYTDVTALSKNAYMEMCLFLVFPLGMQGFHTSLSPETSSFPRGRVTERKILTSSGMKGKKT